MNSSLNSTPSTEEILSKCFEEEKERFERLSNPTYRSADESDRRGAILLEAVFGK